MATIKDIAKQAGVSYSTVSIVLGNRSTKLSVSASTRQHILAVASHLGYRRNALASQMQSGRSGFLSFIANNIRQENVFRIFVGAVRSAAESNYTLKLHDLPFSSDEFSKNEASVRQLYDQIIELRPEGIMVNYDLPSSDYLLAIAHSLKIPVACSDCNSQTPFDFSLVFDEAGGAQQAVSYLANCGYQRLGFLSEPLEKAYVQRRFNGFKSGLQEHHLPWHPEWVCHSAFNSNQDLSDFLIWLFSQPDPPEAFCCASDYIALQAIMILQHLGVKIPEQVALIGYGNILVSSITRPAISTIVQDYEAMGQHLFSELLSRIRQPGQPAGQLQLPTKLLIRQSSAAKPNSPLFATEIVKTKPLTQAKTTRK